MVKRGPPTDPSVNSSVNNRKFGNVEGGKQINLSKKNGEGLIDGFYKGDLFEPADEVKAMSHALFSI